MLQTTNYNLKKIELTDSPPDITVINPNWDSIDAEMKSLRELNNDFAEGTTPVGEANKISGKTINSLFNLNGNIPAGDDLNLYTTPGTWYIISNSSNTSNLPPVSINNNNNSILEVVGESSSVITQKFYSVQNDIIFIRRYCSWLTPQWTSWGKIITNKQPDWITATLLNGWTGTLQYRKNDLGIVSVRFSLTPGTVTLNTVVSSLPVGYRVNSYSLPIDYKITNTGMQESGLYTNEYGGIAISNNSTVIAGQLVHGQFSFYAG